MNAFATNLIIQERDFYLRFRSVEKGSHNLFWVIIRLLRRKKKQKMFLGETNKGE
jgi:hypothetical protein